jgi:two-component system NarL family sensor kinase
MPAMSEIPVVNPGRSAPYAGAGIDRLEIATIACVLVAAAAISTPEDWEPTGLVLALAALMLVADVLPVAARRIRLSAGLLVQVVAMAVLGPAPAVAIGVLATVGESIVNRVPFSGAVHNTAMFASLGLVGGIAFDVMRAWLGLDDRDTAFAFLVMPAYVAIAGLNFAIVTLRYPGTRKRLLRDIGLSSMPLELLSGVMAGATVLVWAHAGLAAAAALLLVLVITIPLVRTVGDALKRSDDLVVLQHVSDVRAAEVARLSSDRERLLSEVLDAERRERARLAESLHDGPMQRLAALRQDVAEASDELSEAIIPRVDAAMAETRAIISSFHPATVQELGFEASLRAAVAPFPAAESIELKVRNAIDGERVEALLIPIAQELVVNAVKHARPTAIRVVVRDEHDRIVLEVDDDGIGIDEVASRRAVQAGHLGLAMVRRRVEDLGGELEIATRADGGTHSRVVLPRRDV